MLAGAYTNTQTHDMSSVRSSSPAPSASSELYKSLNKEKLQWKVNGNWKYEHAAMQLDVKLHRRKDTETGSGISCRNFALMFKYSSLIPSVSLSCRQLSTYQSTNEKILCQRQGEEKSTKFNRGKQFSNNADTHRTMTRCF